MARTAPGQMVAVLVLALVAIQTAQASPNTAAEASGCGGGGGGACEADEADFMQRGLRTAGQNGQGPFLGPGSAAYAAMHPDAVPRANITTSQVEFDCEGRFYRIRFEGGYGRGQWCITDHGSHGVFTKAAAGSALKMDALNRYGLEIGPLDWYGFMRQDRQYQITYADLAAGNLVLEDLGPCTGPARTEWQNQAPTEVEIQNGFQIPPYQEVPEAEAPRKRFAGTWCNYTQADKPQFPQCAGLNVSSKASVFGVGGLLRISTEDMNLTIPHIVDVDTMNRTLPLYGASLVPHGVPLPTASLNVTLVSYGFSPTFQETWVYADDGPGMFLEHHMFPHYYMNPNPNVYPAQMGNESAAITLARQVHPSEDCQAKECAYWITAFTVPSGYTIHCPAGCIHEDWTSQGRAATTLADYSEKDIVNDNTVYLRNENLEKIRFEFYKAGPQRMKVGQEVDANLTRGQIGLHSGMASGSIEYDKVGPELR